MLTFTWLSLLGSVLQACPGVLTAGSDYLCPNITDPDCHCNLKSDSEVQGWNTICYANSNISYTVSYTTNGEFDVTCYREVPFEEATFAKYNRNSADIYKFSECPLPKNVSLDALFKETSVRVLAFDCDTCSPNDVIPENLFRNMRDVIELTLTRFSFRELPADLFDDMVNLERLTLDENNLASLPLGIFDKLNKLTYLSLFKNKLEMLPDAIFQNLGNLETLMLRNNSLKVISDATFRGLYALADLELNENYIKCLPARVFSNTSKLLSLNMQSNQIENIADNIFGKRTALTKLDLSYNRGLSTLPETFLTDTENNVTDIDFSNCNLTTIPEKLFSYVGRLITLSLANNRILKMPNLLFEKLSALATLDLSYNQISTFSDNLFSQTISLQVLKISYNKFQNFPGKPFADLSNLLVLDMQGNQLMSLDSDQSDTLPQLQELYLQKNNISLLTGSVPFGNRKHLSIIDLSQNHLSTLPQLISSTYSNASQIYFSFNDIGYLDTPLLTSDKVHVHLDNNNITFVSVSDIYTLRASSPLIKHDFSLENNPLKCDCSLLPFKEYNANDGRKKMAYFSDYSDLACNEPDNLRGQKLKDIDDRDLICPISNQCPSRCQCYLRSVTRTLEVDCQSRGLSSLPSNVPNNTSVLWMQNNSLITLAGLNQSIWQNLKQINVDDNFITSAEWILPPRLANLSLARNNLTWLPRTLASWVSSNQSTELNLSLNPWVCNCDGTRLLTLLTEYYNMIPDRGSVRCGSAHANSSVMSLSQKLLCPASYRYPVNYIVIICCCLLLGLIASIFCVLYYRNKSTIIAYIYIHFYKIFAILFRESDLDDEKQYHAFVSYSSRDRDLVLSLINELEHKDPPFRLCIHERDWLPGQHIIWNIVSSVQNSRRTILVLSKDFLNSIWFQLEFRIAYYQMLEDKVDRLIVIVHGDLPDRKELDKDLQVLLSTKSYLEWNERWFWEKLRYALPHKKTKPSQQSLAVQRPNTELIREIESKIMTLTQETLNLDESNHTSSEFIELNEVRFRNGE